MLTIRTLISKCKEQNNLTVQLLFGATIMVVGALIRVPFYPVPMTLHTLALFIVALTQTPMQAAASTLLYLVLYPYGFFGLSAGYCFSFPIAAYVISALSQKMHPFLAITAGQAVIYLFGFSWLAMGIGMQEAFFSGVLFFLPAALFKAILATWITRGMGWRQPYKTL